MIQINGREKGCGLFIEMKWKLPLIWIDVTFGNLKTAVWVHPGANPSKSLMNNKSVYWL